MATKKKSAEVVEAIETVEESTSGKPAKGQKRVNADGTPWKPAARRPNAVIIEEYKAKRAALIERHEAALAAWDKRITNLENGGGSRGFRVDPTEAAAALAELTEQGMSADKILELEAKFRKAKAAIKASEKAAVPAFLVDEEADEADEADEE